MSSRSANDYNTYISAVAGEKDRARFRAAEQMTAGERLLAGADLFDLGVSMMRAGIRIDHPDVSEAEIERIVLERLRASERVENRL
jgi:hypothetical protein